MAEPTTEPQTQPGQALERIPDADDQLARRGTWLAAAEGSKDPKGLDGMAAALRLMIAKDYGWPLQAATEIYIIKGRVSISSKMKLALARTAGYRVEREDLTDESCTVRVISPAGHPLGSSTFEMDEARKVGLDTKDNYKHWPQRMLWWRAVGRAIDDYCPEVALGFTTREELDGDYIDVEAVEIEEPPET